MTQIIEEFAKQFKEVLATFSAGEDVSVEQAEKVLTGKVYQLITGYLGALYEAKDEEIRQDKQRRKDAGMTVQRRNDERQILSVFGGINYRRTYYKVANGYEYPVDSIAGVEPYERISQGTGLALVSNACRYSYARSAEIVTGGEFSKQTVMRKIRQIEVSKPAVRETRKKIAVLHIDADEDHVALQTGENAIVPVVTVYEGKKRVCKGRNRCENAFSISRFGWKAEDFWCLVYDEIAARYDIDEAAVYLHADGGNWIQEALNWFPGMKFVLDDYHKNKYIKLAVSGIDKKTAKQYEEAIRDSLHETDDYLLQEIKASMLVTFPDRKKTIRQGLDYLLSFFDGIHIKDTDCESRNGGASEPHVQHVLSARLSSIPMGWSRETLKHLAPVLAAKEGTFTSSAPEEEQKNRVVRETQKKTARHTLGLADPDRSVRFTVFDYGNTPLTKALHAFGDFH